MYLNNKKDTHAPIIIPPIKVQIISLIKKCISYVGNYTFAVLSHLFSLVELHTINNKNMLCYSK